MKATTDSQQDVLRGDLDHPEPPNGELEGLAPELSARTLRPSRTQAAALAAAGAATVGGLALSPMTVLTVLVCAGTLLFCAVTLQRLLTAWHGLDRSNLIAPSAEEVRSLSDDELPVYSILIPLYGEKPETVASLIRALRDLDYPSERLDVMLILEADDPQTRTAVEMAAVPPWVRQLDVPPGGPRTKPKALTHALPLARGELLTVYDAEDRPAPDQLRKAAWTFANHGAEVSCLQARLGYYNPRQNLLTRWFTLEYAAWFELILPGLHANDVPIPLGGTSNHFRRADLMGIGGWDPYNVTEDADLGIRVARSGGCTRMLDSVTHEEANSRVGNWVRQRSRWIKGYIQTAIVHSRHPRALARDVGARRASSLMLLMAGSVVGALLAPIFAGILVLYAIVQPEWVTEALPAPVYYFALASLTLGNFLLLMVPVAAAVADREDDLVLYALLIPLYWCLICVAAVAAVVDLVRRPHHWHKTEHGLFQEAEPVLSSA